MNTRHIAPANRVQGSLRLPGDKSIAHRAALIGAISEGTTVAGNFPRGADCRSTIACLRQLGVQIERDGDQVRIHGRGLGGLKAPDGPLDAGNSGTTVRLLAGILAGHPFVSTIVGDESLSRRPMMRVVEPLLRFGARVESADGCLPLQIRGGRLAAISYRTPVASAQVKSAVLLAGTHASGTTVLEEPQATRDHTELALSGAGASLRRARNRVEVDGGVALRARALDVPGDISSAAFFIAAALGLPDSELKLSEVGCNPTRTGFTELLQKHGGRIDWGVSRDEAGEAVGDIEVRSSQLAPIRVGPLDAPALVDELPMLAVVGALSGQGVEIRGAGELRHKESDRIHALVVNLRAIGAAVEEYEDGLSVTGSGIRGGRVSSFGDHRVAMAFAVAGLMAPEGVTIDDPDCVDISFPGFFDCLDSVVKR